VIVLSVTASYINNDLMKDGSVNLDSNCGYKGIGDQPLPSGIEFGDCESGGGGGGRRGRAPAGRPPPPPQSTHGYELPSVAGGHGLL
jgi:hypothetical protein